MILSSLLGCFSNVSYFYVFERFACTFDFLNKSEIFSSSRFSSFAPMILHVDDFHVNEKPDKCSNLELSNIVYTENMNRAFTSLKSGPGLSFILLLHTYGVWW